MFKGDIPIVTWSDCILTVAYLINCTPSILSGKCPYELVFGSKPSLKHLKSFGCLVFCTKLNPTIKFDSRSIKYVFVGYSSQIKRLQNVEFGN